RLGERRRRIRQPVIGPLGAGEGGAGRYASRPWVRRAFDRPDSVGMRTLPHFPAPSHRGSSAEDGGWISCPFATLAVRCKVYSVDVGRGTLTPTGATTCPT